MKAENQSSPVWLWNGNAVPVPDNGIAFLSEQLMSEERNANGAIIAEMISRRQVKHDAIQWSYLSAQQWETILQEVKKCKVIVTYYEPMEHKEINRLFYFGETSAQPFEWDCSSNRVAVPLSYINCKVNLIDMGY